MNSDVSYTIGAIEIEIGSNCHAPYDVICENMTSSTKPEVLNIALSSEKDSINMHIKFREVWTMCFLFRATLC